MRQVLAWMIVVGTLVGFPVACLVGAYLTGGIVSALILAGCMAGGALMGAAMWWASKNLS